MKDLTYKPYPHPDLATYEMAIKALKSLEKGAVASTKKQKLHQRKTHLSFLIEVFSKHSATAKLSKTNGSKRSDGVDRSDREQYRRVLKRWKLEGNQNKKSLNKKAWGDKTRGHLAARQALGAVAKLLKNLDGFTVTKANLDTANVEEIAIEGEVDGEWMEKNMELVKGKWVLKKKNAPAAHSMQAGSRKDEYIKRQRAKIKKVPYGGSKTVDKFE